MSDYEKYYYLGVSQYRQMTAGSYCYIGPQAIVHGPTITACAAAVSVGYRRAARSPISGDRRDRDVAWDFAGVALAPIVVVADAELCRGLCRSAADHLSPDADD